MSHPYREQQEIRQDIVDNRIIKAIKKGQQQNEKQILAIKKYIDKRVFADIKMAVASGCQSFTISGHWLPEITEMSIYDKLNVALRYIETIDGLFAKKITGDKLEITWPIK